MSTARKSASKSQEPMVPVAFRARRQMVEDFRRVVAQDERTLGSALRLHMAQVVADARDENGELERVA